MEVYARVRRAVQVDGMSIRQAAREFALARKTIRKMLMYSVPPGYERKKRTFVRSWDHGWESYYWPHQITSNAPTSSGGHHDRSSNFAIVSRAKRTVRDMSERESSEIRYLIDFMEPPAGIEPATC